MASGNSFRLCILCFLCLLSSCFPVKLVKAVRQTKNSELTQKEFLTEIPFEFIRNEIVLKGQFYKNSPEKTYFLDTGAPMVISLESFKTYQFPAIHFSPDLATSLRNDSIAQRNVLSIFPELPEFHIQALSFKNIGSYIVNESGLEKFACFAPDGIIGSNIMNDAIWQIDYSHKVLVVTDELKNLNNIEGASKVKFKTYGSHKTPLVPLKLNGKKYWFTFDTGSANGIILSPELLPHYLDSDKTSHINFTTSGLGTLYKEHEEKPLKGSILKLKEFKTGALIVSNQEVTAMNLPFFEKHPLKKQKHGNIGNKFLQDYIVTINWKNNTIYFASQPNKVKKANDAHFGFAGRFNTDKKYVVQILFGGSEAEKAGIKLNDEIIAVNGISTENLSDERYCELSNYPEKLISDDLQEATFTIRTLEGEIKEYKFNRQPLFPEPVNTTSAK